MAFVFYSATLHIIGPQDGFMEVDTLFPFFYRSRLWQIIYKFKQVYCSIYAEEEKIPEFVRPMSPVESYLAESKIILSSKGHSIKEPKIKTKSSLPVVAEMEVDNSKDLTPGEEEHLNLPKKSKLDSFKNVLDEKKKSKRRKTKKPEKQVGTSRKLSK